MHNSHPWLPSYCENSMLLQAAAPCSTSGTCSPIKILPIMQLSTTAMTTTIPCAAAPHSKSGVTTNPKLADKNQQGTLPHLRLMEWVWSYFVDSSTESDTQHDAGHKSSTRAGAVHAQPSKQDSGSSHWRGQEDDQSRKQQKTDGHKQQTAPLSSPSPASRRIISKTGEYSCLVHVEDNAKG